MCSIEFHVSRFAKVLLRKRQLYYLGGQLASVAEWLSYLISIHLPLTAVISNPTWDFEYFMLGNNPPSMRNFGGAHSCLK
jgi:hypothetical protein